MEAEAVSLASSNISATVVSTGDGDTLRVQAIGRSEATIVRIGCIDAPENSQPGGDWSAAQLAQMLPSGSLIEITPLDVDRYGRTVAEVWRSGQSLNLELVKLGAAVVYPQYLSQCSNPDSFETAQAQARGQQLGFWSLPSEHQIMPWDWRAQTKNR